MPLASNRSSRRVVGLLTALFAFGAVSAEAQVRRSVPIQAADIDNAPHSSTGLLMNYVTGGYFRGSAAVARDARILYTCGHMIYSDGVWATDLEFFRAWNTATQPAPGAGVTLRGYRYLAPYATITQNNTDFAFSNDFAIGYRAFNTNFGPALAIFPDGITQLQSASTEKVIVGYPAVIPPSEASAGFVQHTTGLFTNAFTTELGAYLGTEGVSTGPGNSGGPVLVLDGGEHKLAGILIAGNTGGTFSGVYALDPQANTIATNTINYLNAAAAAGTRVLSNTKRFRLPDAAKLYTYRPFRASGLNKHVLVGAVISVNIETTFVPDISAYLRSPTGRVRVLASQSVDRFSVVNSDVTTTFLGANPNGEWRLYMRDSLRIDKAFFTSARLELTAMR